MISLDIDTYGNIWLTEEYRGFLTDRFLGPADDPATGDCVPAGLLGRFEALRAEWAERMANAEADRDEVEASYRRNKLS